MSDAKPSIEQTAEQIWEALKLHKLEDTPYEWLIEGWIPKGELSMYTGQFASLKTYLEFLWTKAICTGTPFADRWEAEQHNVLILDRQSGKATLTLRRNAVGLNDQQNVVVIGLHTNPGSLDMELDNKVLEEICRKYRPAIFVDSLVDYIPNGRSEQDPSTMREVMRQFTKLIISGRCGRGDSSPQGQGRGQFLPWHDSDSCSYGAISIPQQEGNEGLHPPGREAIQGTRQRRAKDFPQVRVPRRTSRKRDLHRPRGIRGRNSQPGGSRQECPRREPRGKRERNRASGRRPKGADFEDTRFPP